MLDYISEEAISKENVKFEYTDSLNLAVTLSRKRTQWLYTERNPKTTFRSKNIFHYNPN